MTAVIETAETVAAETTAAPSVTIGVAELLTLLTNGLLFASKDDTLPVLNTVRLEIGAEYVTAVSTDRYRLGEIRFKHTERAGDEFTFLLSVADAKRWISALKTLPVLRGMGSRAIVLTLEMDGERLTWRDGLLNEASGAFQQVYGDYPRIRQLFPGDPTAREAGVYGFNPAYLGDICKLKNLADTSADKHMPVRMVPGATHEKPVCFFKGDWARVLLMPVRVPGGPHTAEELYSAWS